MPRRRKRAHHMTAQARGILAEEKAQARTGGEGIMRTSTYNRN